MKLTAINFKTIIEAEEAENIMRAQDWVTQIGPNQEGGASLLYAHSCDAEAFRMSQTHLADHPLIKDIKEILLPPPPPLTHGTWWLTIGWGYLKRPKWKWGMTQAPDFAEWNCPACAGKHVPAYDLDNRVFTMADKDAKEDGDISLVMLRLCNWKMEEKDGDGRNLCTRVKLLRAGALWHELVDGPKTRQDILKAVVRCNKKAVAFHNEFCSEHIVEVRACDFRKALKKNRAARVAVCDDPALSLRYVGQGCTALVLDKAKIRPMDRDEFRSILTGLGMLYDVADAACDGPFSERQKRMFLEEIKFARATKAMANVDIKDSQPRDGAV